jgi:hypothetical protein
MRIRISWPDIRSSRTVLRLVNVTEHESKHGIGRGEAKPNRDRPRSINRRLSL